MKAFRLIFAVFLIVLSFTISTVAQNTKTQINVQTKIALIDRDAFYKEETGIRDLVDIDKKVRDELEPQIEEHERDITKLKMFEKEFDEIEARLKSQGVIETDVNQERIDEYKSMICQFKSRQEELLSSFEKRRLELSKDENTKILEALKQFAKEQNYGILIDGTTLKDSYFPVLDNYPFQIPDVTEEFIKFYNSTFGSTKIR